MGFLSALFGTGKLNADPVQQQLAGLLIAAANGSGSRSDVTNFLIRSPWDASETRNRIVHAVSLPKMVCDAPTYVKVKKLGLELHNVSYF